MCLNVGGKWGEVGRGGEREGGREREMFNNNTLKSTSCI